MRKAYIGLGSNLGDRPENLNRALERLREHPDIRVAAASHIYETEPQERGDQPWFLNAVIRIETGLSPHALLSFLKETEALLGRTSTVRFGPRVVDMDILLYEGENVCEESLKIPHPRMGQRAFVLIPLAELAPGLLLPDGEAVQEGARRTGETQKVNLYGNFQLPGQG